MIARCGFDRRTTERQIGALVGRVRVLRKPSMLGPIDGCSVAADVAHARIALRSPREPVKDCNCGSQYQSHRYGKGRRFSPQPNERNRGVQKSVKHTRTPRVTRECSRPPVTSRVQGLKKSTAHAYRLPDPRAGDQHGREHRTSRARAADRCAQRRSQAYRCGVRHAGQLLTVALLGLAACSSARHSSSSHPSTTTRLSVSTSTAAFGSPNPDVALTSCGPKEAVTLNVTNHGSDRASYRVTIVFEDKHRTAVDHQDFTIDRLAPNDSSLAAFTVDFAPAVPTIAHCLISRVTRSAT